MCTKRPGAGGSSSTSTSRCPSTSIPANPISVRNPSSTAPPPFPPPRAARLSGESVTTGRLKICRRSVALTTRPFTPLPPLAGGRGQGEGADEPVCGASPLKGGEGLVSAGIILVERDASRAIKFSSPDSPAHRGRGGDQARRAWWVRVRRLRVICSHFLGRRLCDSLGHRGIRRGGNAQWRRDLA
jgi:hypothetical protein